MSKKKPLKIIAGTPDRPLVIGDVEIPCYVLEDEMRVLSQRGLTAGIGLNPEAGFRMPQLLMSKAITPFISKELMPALNEPILFQNPAGGGNVYGYAAEIIEHIIDTILAAESSGALPNRYASVADRMRILNRGLRRIGIIGLVDEATGYQKIRDRQALHKILDKFLTHEARKWSKTFPDEFWHKLIKVKGCPNYIALKRPSFVGHWVNDVVYSRLAPGIANKLKEINPRIAKGNRRYKHHQHLTVDHGIPELKEHLIKVMVLMDAASNSREFNRLLNTSLPKYSEQLNLPLS